MTDFSYNIRQPDKGRPTFGLVVLQADRTIESDLRRLLPGGTANLLVTRVPSALMATGETLAEMGRTLPAAAALFPEGMPFDVVGYGCTSGTSVIGAARVAELIRSGCDAREVTEPLSALVGACRHLGISRLALLSPYVAEVSATLRGALSDAGVETPVFGSFNEAEEARVASIDDASLLEAAVALGGSDQSEAVFLSCTNLKTLDVIAEIEAAVGKPVLSSNLVLAWHMCALTGIELPHEGFGSLLAGAAIAQGGHQAAEYPVRPDQRSARHRP